MVEVGYSVHVGQKVRGVGLGGVRIHECVSD